MSDELNKEILKELKKIHEKLDNLNEHRGLSSPMKIIALFFGFMVIGPLFGFIISRLFN